MGRAAQTPEFAEYTLVLRGTVIVEHDEGTTEVAAGQAFACEPGEKIRYSCGPEGAEYIAVCLPAFSPRPSTAPNDRAAILMTPARRASPCLPFRDADVRRRGPAVPSQDR
ncbi:cupin domain-containing protein [Streptosporangium lutulentum]